MTRSNLYKRNKKTNTTKTHFVREFNLMPFGLTTTHMIMLYLLKNCFCTGRLFLKKSYRKMTENVEVGFFLQFSQTSAKIVTTSSVTGR